MSKPIFPGSGSALHGERSKFEAWLSSHGSEIRAPSNPYELMRFTTPEGVGVIYRDARGAITAWMNGADVAWKAFKTGDDAWRLTPKRVRMTKSKKDHRVAAIIERDGNTCWYCGEYFGASERRLTVEHLVSVVHGGPDHLSNLVIAHERCNQTGGNMSVAEKVRLREQMRSA